MSRKDRRSNTQFARDIRVAHISEAAICLRICQFFKNQSDKWPEISVSSPNFVGDIIEDSEVSTFADFKIGNEYYEITRSNVFCNRYFHEKRNKTERCLNGEFNMVFVNGYTKNTVCPFCIIGPEEMKIIAKRSISTHGFCRQPGHGNTGLTQKTAYRINIDWPTNWYQLPLLSGKIPEDYSFLTELV